MGNPLIAGLHFDRALELDSACADAAGFKENLRLGSLPMVAADETREQKQDAGDQPPLLVSSNRVSDVDNPGDEDNLTVTTPKSVPPGVTAEVQRGTRTEGCVGRARKSTRDADRGALAEACEEYRAGVVLHQEAFLRSSREKFCRVLELLDEMADHTEKYGLSTTVPAKCVRGGDCEESSSARGAPRPAGEAVAEGGAVLTRVRVACHLNIAAAALLRKTEYESAVDHCTR